MGHGPSSNPLKSPTRGHACGACPRGAAPARRRQACLRQQLRDSQRRQRCTNPSTTLCVQCGVQSGALF